MNDEVVKLLAERYFSKENVPDWAIKCIEKGFDSKSLRMLASMNNFDSSSELDEYLKRSLKELGWDKISEKNFLMRYAEILAQKILEDKTDPIKSSRDICQILVDLDYPSELHGWYEIDEMIWAYEYFLKTNEKGYFYRPKGELVGEIKVISKELLKSK